MNPEQQKEFIKRSREAGMKDDKIVSFLQSKGVDLGVVSGQEVKQTPEQDLGGRKDSTFQFSGDEGVGSLALKTIGNIPSSSFGLAKDVTTAVFNPIDTAKAVFGTVKGGGTKLAREVSERIGFEDTANRVPQSPEEQQFVGVMNFFKDRYGSLDAIKETVVEDPVGFLADAAALLTGGGTALKGAGTISKVSKVADVTRAGEALVKAGQTIEPLNIAGATAGKASDFTKKSLVGRVASDIVPTGSKIKSGEVIKALDLTAGDVAKISEKTGNDITEFIIRKNVLKDAPDKIATALVDDVQLPTMQLVRDEISKVKKLYSVDEASKLKQGLEVIQAGVGDIPGLEAVSDNIRALLSKEEFTLSDFQAGKELIDSNSNIFSAFGDVKQSSQAKGLANIRQELRKFIEDEVSLNTDGTVDIKALNNDVATSKEISDAIVNRETRSLTRQGLTVFEGLLGFSAFSTGGILPAVGILVGKKVLESPAFRIALVQGIEKVSPARLKTILAEVKKGTLSESNAQLLADVVEKAKQATPIIESGAAALDSASSSVETQ